MPSGKYNLADQDPPYNFITRVANKVRRHVAGASARVTARLYRYAPLSVDNDQIRIFRLLPGEHHSPICISIANVAYTDEHIPEYEAISYTWGNSRSSAFVYIADPEDHKPKLALRVNKNCEQALRYLRLRTQTQPRTLWLDAICINQKDIEERARQVTLMYSIYSSATRVTAWLGPQTESSVLAMGWIIFISEQVSFDPSTNVLVNLTEDPMWTEFGSTASISAEQLGAMAEFLARPWFTRL